MERIGAPEDYGTHEREEAKSWKHLHGYQGVTILIKAQRHKR